MVSEQYMRYYSWDAMTWMRRLLHTEVTIRTVEPVGIQRIQAGQQSDGFSALVFTLDDLTVAGLRGDDEAGRGGCG